MCGGARVVHLTTVHTRYDVRIFRKQCTSLAARGYDVHLLVADGRGEEINANVTIHDIGRVRDRSRRMLLQPLRMWRAARGLRAQIYHFHDPELLPVGLLLRFGRRHVVYDAHEDLPRALLSKDWIHPSWRRLIATVLERLENLAVHYLSAVVAATPHIAQRFAPHNARSLDINNYPLQSEIDTGPSPRGKERTVCYVGGIGRIRGAFEMINALEHVNARLILAGPFESGATETALRALPAWSRVDFRGVVNREQVRQIMAESCAGLLFFHPEPNHIEAQPNKMFEYMAAGLPVLASDFPLWRKLLVESGAGRCADPMDPRAIAHAIQQTLADPLSARAMGERGRDAVLSRYQWTSEERKLHDLYTQLLEVAGRRRPLAGCARNDKS